eukprot:scaffold12862_cov116-Isochrysis_galbana.AAC.7
MLPLLPLRGRLAALARCSLYRPAAASHCSVLPERLRRLAPVVVTVLGRRSRAHLRAVLKSARLRRTGCADSSCPRRYTAAGSMQRRWVDAQDLLAALGKAPDGAVGRRGPPLVLFGLERQRAEQGQLASGCVDDENL